MQGFGTTGISKFKDKGDNTEMALRTIRTEGDSVLEKICRPVEKIDKRTKDLVGDMLETMYDACGVGLAAPQVDRKSTRLNSSHKHRSRMPSSA